MEGILSNGIFTGLATETARGLVAAGATVVGTPYP